MQTHEQPASLLLHVTLCLHTRMHAYPVSVFSMFCGDHILQKCESLSASVLLAGYEYIHRPNS